MHKHQIAACAGTTKEYSSVGSPTVHRSEAFRQSNIFWPTGFDQVIGQRNQVQDVALQAEGG
jgi:hypothetical protein